MSRSQIVGVILSAMDVAKSHLAPLYRGAGCFGGAGCRVSDARPSPITLVGPRIANNVPLVLSASTRSCGELILAERAKSALFLSACAAWSGFRLFAILLGEKSFHVATWRRVLFRSCRP